MRGQVIWAMQSSYVDSFVRAVVEKEADVPLAMFGPRGRRITPSVPENVALIEIRDVLSQDGGFGTTYVGIDAKIDAAEADDSIDSLLFVVNSPGGTVLGLEGTALRIKNASKPTAAHVTGWSASAAYYLASQADSVSAEPGAAIGSLGVIQTVIDDHRFFESIGFDFDHIVSHPNKAIGRAGRKISQGDRVVIQEEVDAYEELFREAVQRGRGMDEAALDSVFDARMHEARAAKALGLIDKISDFKTVAMRAAQNSKSNKSPIAATHSRGTAMSGENEKSAAEIAANILAKMGVTLPSAAAAPTPTPPQVPPAQAPVPAASNAEILAAERERVAKITAAAQPGQEKLAAKLCADGAEYTDALEALLADKSSANAATLAARAEASSPDGQAPAVTPVTADPGGSDSAQAGISAEQLAYESNAELVEKFGDWENGLYAAHQQLESGKARAKYNSYGGAEKTGGAR